jgi:hypothetical protein
VPASSLLQPRSVGRAVVDGILWLNHKWRAGARRLRWQRELIFVGVLYGLYELSRGVTDGGYQTALDNGRRFLTWERHLHLDPERTLNVALSHAKFFAVLASYDYSTLHYVITPIVLIWMFRRHRAHYRSARTTLAWSTVVGLIGFYFVPTAPPRLLQGAHFHDILAEVQNWGWWSDDGSVPSGMGGLSNQFAAMPSLHVGWALWAGILLLRYSPVRAIRVLGVLYPLTTTWVVLATGNHYLLDAIAGAAAIGIAALLTKLFLRVPAEDDPDYSAAFDDIAGEIMSGAGSRSEVLAAPEPVRTGSSSAA